MTVSLQIYSWILRGLAFLALRHYWRTSGDDSPLLFAPLRTPDC